MNFVLLLDGPRTCGDSVDCGKTWIYVTVDNIQELEDKIKEKVLGHAYPFCNEKHPEKIVELVTVHELKGFEKVYDVEELFSKGEK